MEIGPRVKCPLFLLECS